MLSRPDHNTWRTSDEALQSVGAGDRTASGRSVSDVVAETMGRSKQEVFGMILGDDQHRVQRALQEFERVYGKTIQQGEVARSRSELTAT